jgi:hypothetical protein
LKLKVTIVDQLHPFGAGLDGRELEFCLGERWKAQGEKHNHRHPLNQRSRASRDRFLPDLAGCGRKRHHKPPRVVYRSGFKQS